MQWLLLAFVALTKVHAGPIGLAVQDVQRNVQKKAHENSDTHVLKAAHHALYKSFDKASDQASDKTSHELKEAGQDASAEVAGDSASEVTQEVANEVTSEVAKESSKESSNEADASTEVSSEMSDEASGESANEAASELAKERAASKEELRMRRARQRHRVHRLHREVVAERMAMRAQRMAEREQRRQIPINQNPRIAGVKISRLIESFLTTKPVTINNNISPKHPLVFMHQAKSGGTSLRASLHEAAHRLNLKTYIPCHDVDCQEYNTVGQVAAIYGGHFCWKSMVKDFYSRGVNQFSCVTIFRDPVPRVLSCYSYRLVGKLGSAPTCVADVPPEQLKSELQGHACVDEPFRRIGDCNAAGEIEHFHTDQEHVQGWSLTLSHLSQCVPLIIEEPESYKVAAAAFPQLAEAFLDLGKVKLNKNKEYDEHCHPTQAHLRAVRAVTSQESRIYKAARKRMWQLHRLLVK